MANWHDCSWVFTDGKCDCVMDIFIWQIDRTLAVCLLTVRVTVLRKYFMANWQDCSCVFTDGTCDCVKEIFIWQIDRTLAVCLLTVRVTV